MTKYTVRMDREIIEEIRALSRQGSVADDVIRKALKLLKYFTEATSNGYDLFLEKRLEGGVLDRVKVIMP